MEEAQRNETAEVFRFSDLVQRVGFMLEQDASLSVEECVGNTNTLPSIIMDQYPTNDVENTMFDALVQNRKVKSLWFNSNDANDVFAIADLLNRSKGHVEHIRMNEMRMGSESQANRLFSELSSLDLRIFGVVFCREDYCVFFMQALVRFVRESLSFELLQLFTVNVEHAIPADAFQSICDAIRTSPSMNFLTLLNTFVQGENQHDILVDTIVRSKPTLRGIEIIRTTNRQFQAIIPSLHVFRIDILSGRLTGLIHIPWKRLRRMMVG